MKKILLITCLISASVVTFAQSVQFGIKAGPNFSKLHRSIPSIGYLDDYSDNSHTNILFNAEIFAEFRFHNFSVQPALAFTGKGGRYNNAKDKFGNDVGKKDPKISFYYLQIPVHIIYNIPLATGEIYVGAGPYIGYRVNKKSTLNGFETSSSSIQPESMASIYKKTDAGLSAITGFKFKNGLLFNINYNLGLTDIGISNGDGSLKTRALGLSVGYVFK